MLISFYVYTRSLKWGNVTVNSFFCGHSVSIFNSLSSLENILGGLEWWINHKWFTQGLCDKTLRAECCTSFRGKVNLNASVARFQQTAPHQVPPSPWNWEALTWWWRTALWVSLPYTTSWIHCSTTPLSHKPHPATVRLFINILFL